VCWVYLFENSLLMTIQPCKKISLPKNIFTKKYLYQKISLQEYIFTGIFFGVLLFLTKTWCPFLFCQV